MHGMYPAPRACMAWLTVRSSHDMVKAMSHLLVVTVLLLFILLACNQCEAAVAADEVTSLPGWDKPLPSKQYSGYIEIQGTGKRMHYWFVESLRDPTSDPLVLWLNGGPGCSSLDGYFNELGPLHFDRSLPDDGRFPTLVLNPWAWTNISNVIFLESPAGVGFSYSTIDYNFTDELTAQDNYQFLVNWFHKYPEYLKHDFYVTGESYAGIFVPTLVSVISANNKVVGPNGTTINLKGFAVGNGCTGKDTGGCSDKEGIKIHVDFYHYHGLFSNELYEKMEKVCDFTNISGSSDCLPLLGNMSTEIGPVNIYDIYTKCSINMGNKITWRALNPLQTLLETIRDLEQPPPPPPPPPSGPLGCIDDHIERLYFDNERVRAAIHVEPVSVSGGWHLCTMLPYKHTISSVLPIYPSLIEQYRTLIYNGDVDGCVPFNGNEAWTSGLGYKAKNGGWRPWMVDNQVAGYVTEYEDANGFQFVTVKGSGHMVPQYRPKSAYYMFERFLQNTSM